MTMFSSSKLFHIFSNLLGLSLGLTCLFLGGWFIYQTAFATTNISSNVNEYTAWNDLFGWADFYNTNTVTVNSHGLSGYASSTAGDLSLDCATTRVGNICGTSTYRVTNDGAGNLSGYAWNDTYGWFSFDCNNNGGCATSSYRVYIDGTGRFQNYAWNDVAGWVSFNCANPGICARNDYKVVTSWVATSAVAVLDSATYDTGSTSGAALNSLYWNGSLPSNTQVLFQLATSNSTSGPWNFIGPDGTNLSYYTTNPGVTIKLDYTLHNNKRYFRYRVTLISNLTQTVSPQVDEVRINWSP